MEIRLGIYIQWQNRANTLFDKAFGAHHIILMDVLIFPNLNGVLRHLFENCTCEQQTGNSSKLFILPLFIFILFFFFLFVCQMSRFSCSCLSISRFTESVSPFVHFILMPIEVLNFCLLYADFIILSISILRVNSILVISIKAWNFEYAAHS